MRGTALAAALLVAATPSKSDVQQERRRGDELSFALPGATLAVELLRGDGRGAWQMLQTFALTTGSTELIKRATNVERPDGSDRLSFPSGHAARAFAAAAYVHRRHGVAAAWPLIGLAAYVGHTRVISDRHRWADVAGAAALSYGFAWAVVTPTAPQAMVRTDGQGGWQLTVAVPLK